MCALLWVWLTFCTPHLREANIAKLDKAQVDPKTVNIDLHGPGAAETAGAGDSEKFQAAISDIKKQEVDSAKDSRTLDEAKAQAAEWKK